MNSIKQAKVHRKHLLAFTLIELLVSVAVVSILIAAAAPALNNFSQGQNQRNIILIWIKHLNYLKNEAAATSRAITLKTSDYSKGFVAKDAFGTTILVYKNTIDSITISSSEYSSSSPITFNTDGGANNIGTLNFKANSCTFASLSINIAGQITPTYKDC